MRTTGRACRSRASVYCDQGVKCDICREFEALEGLPKAAYHAADHAKGCPFADGVCTCWIGQADAVLRAAGLIL